MFIYIYWEHGRVKNTLCGRRSQSKGVDKTAPAFLEPILCPATVIPSSAVPVKECAGVRGTRTFETTRSYVALTLCIPFGMVKTSSESV